MSCEIRIRRLKGKLIFQRVRVTRLKKPQMTLQHLSIGDYFVHANARGAMPKRFKVTGKPIYNPRHGSSTRECIDIDKKKVVSKSCRLEVRAVGEKKLGV